MKIQVLEYQPTPDSPTHSVTSGKAKCLVELGWAVRISKRVIQICIAKTWSAIKAWMAGTKEQREAIMRREADRAAWAIQNQARSEFPSGADFNFGRWPCEDQRTMGVFV